MPRLLLTLNAFAASCGIAAMVVPASQQHVEIIGQKRPLFLGRAVVTASALPPR